MAASPSPAVRVRITQTREEEEEGRHRSYVVYRVECQAPGTGELLAEPRWRRFRDFEAIASRLKASGAPRLRLPPKTLGKHATNVSKRRANLELALQRYVGLQQPMSPLLVDWLGLPAELHAAPGDGARAGKQALGSSPELRAAVALVQRQAAAEVGAKTARNVANVHGTLLHLAIAAAAVVLTLIASVPDLRAPWGLALLTGALCSTVAWLGASVVWRRAVAAAAAEMASAAAVGEGATKDLAGASEADTWEGGSFEAVAAEVAALLGLGAPCHAGEAAAVMPAVLEASAGGEGSPLPEHLQSLMDRSLELLRLNLREDFNSEGQSWHRASGRPGADIWSSALPGHKHRMWKSVVEVTASADLEELRRVLLHWPTRLKWDASFSSGEVVKAFHGDCELCVYRSKPAAGGAVSAREFVDLRCYSEFDAGVDGLKGFDSAVFTLPADEPLASMVPKDGSSIIRAATLPGCGMRVSPLPCGADGRRRWLVQTIGNADIKGWVPVRAINMAMSGTLADACESLSSYMHTHGQR